MGKRRDVDGVLPGTHGKHRVGSLVQCKWMDGLCIVVDYEKRALYSIYRVYHFEEQDYYWVDYDEVDFI